MGKKICERCKKRIKKTDKAVLWKTFEGDDILEEVYWHFNCFLEWRNESLENRAMKIYNKTLNISMSKLKSMFKNISNNEEETKEDSVLQFRPV